MSNESNEPICATTLPPTAAADLVDMVDAIRGQTWAWSDVGLLDVSADDLVGGTMAFDWVEDLRACAERAGRSPVPLPERDVGELRQVVYALSALITWADDLRDHGLALILPINALSAWGVVEEAAGMPGRTAACVTAAAPRADRGPTLTVVSLRTARVARFARQSELADAAAASTAAATAGATSALNTLGMM